jgi:hypothetical protein
MNASMVLETGLLLDRFGSEYGKFLGAVGGPYVLLSTNLNAPSNDPYAINYHVHKVAKPFVVVAGPIAGAFGQQGLGTQFVTPDSIQSVVKGCFLTQLDLTSV